MLRNSDLFSIPVSDDTIEGCFMNMIAIRSLEKNNNKLFGVPLLGSNKQDGADGDYEIATSPINCDTYVSGSMDSSTDHCNILSFLYGTGHW